MPAEIIEAIDIGSRRKPSDIHRTIEQWQEWFRHRPGIDSFGKKFTGTLIGDEAKHQLEDEIIQRVEAETGERIDDQSAFFVGHKGSPDPSKLRLKAQVQAASAAATTAEQRFGIALKGLAVGYGHWNLEPEELKAYRRLLGSYSSEELCGACWRFWGEPKRRYFPLVREFRAVLDVREPGQEGE